MAGEVTPQAEGARSLHLRQLRAMANCNTSGSSDTCTGLDVFGSGFYLRCRKY